MHNIIQNIGRYATKAEVAQLIADEYHNAIEFREASSGKNALGENPKQRFEALLHESNTEGRTFATTSPQNLPPITTELIQKPKYWIQDPSPSGIQAGQYKTPYVIPTQSTNMLPQRTYGNPLEYDSKYTMNRQISNNTRLTGSETYIPESRWNNYKGTRVPSTQNEPITGDTILRSFMNIQNPQALRKSGYSIDGKLTEDIPLESTHTQEPPYYTERSQDVVRDKVNPINIIEIQSRTMSMSLGGALSNSMYTKTEENIDTLSKGSE